MKIRNRRDFAAGTMYACFGVGCAAPALGYRMGTAIDMGPGYFPFWLGLLLIAVGASVAIGAMHQHSPVTILGRWDLRGIGIILGAVLLFALMLAYAGLALSVFAMVLLSSFASDEFKWSASLLNALVLSVLSVLIFTYGLSLQLPVWPTAVGG